jgi:hypothetical protein
LIRRPNTRLPASHNAILKERAYVEIEQSMTIWSD